MVVGSNTQVDSLSVVSTSILLPLLLNCVSLVLSRFLLPCCRSFVFSHFGRYIYIGGMLVRFLPLRRVTATEFLVGALPALVVVYLLVRDQNWPRLNPMSFGFPCSKFPVFVIRVDALAVWRPSSIMLSQICLVAGLFDVPHVVVNCVPISLIILSSFHLVRHASISVSSVDVIFPV